jgi:hypothetical protein
MYFIYGALVGVAMTIALGHAIVRDHGRKWIPLLVALAVLVAVGCGWGLGTTMHDLYGM